MHCAAVPADLRAGKRAGGAVNRVPESGCGLPSAVAIKLCQQK